MCGICGFTWEDKDLVKSMAKIITYRGPNQEGYFTEEGISLGHKRLSIIDLSEQGRQPMFNEDRSIVLIFNGEIYNFQELRKELIEKGHIFTSKTDTEVIVHAYEEYGEDCLKHFNGMFAFALWDNKKKSLFIARDHIGIKPLYYYHEKGKFLFASEIKALLQSPLIKRELNEDCLRQAIHYEFPIRGDTFIKGVKQLEPGHYALYKEGTLTIKRYYEIKIAEEEKSLAEYKEELKALLTDTVKRMLVSDVPVGITLSGGVDSSVIVALASKLSTKPIKTYTLGFNIPEDEYAAARIVAKHCKTDHTEIHLNAKDYVENLPKVLWHMEFPFSRPAMVPVYYMYEKLAKKVKVSLCGDGADEIFAGYNRYDAYTELPSKSEVNPETYEQLAKKINLPLKDKIIYISSGVFTKDASEFFTDKILALPKELEVMNTFGPRLLKTKKNESYLNQALKYELETEIPYFHCNKLDKNSMAHSHEVRVPYLDHRIVDYALTIPSKYKFYGARKKIILQELAKELLPEEIALRKKLPMVTPISEFFKKELIIISKKLFQNSLLIAKGYAKKERILKLIKTIEEEKTMQDKENVTPDNQFRQLLFLTNVEIWMRIFLTRKNGTNVPTMSELLQA